LLTTTAGLGLVLLPPAPIVPYARHDHDRLKKHRSADRRLSRPTWRATPEIAARLTQSTAEKEAATAAPSPCRDCRAFI
jgi:hypothetical protein